MPYEYFIDCPSPRFDTIQETRRVTVVVTEAFLDYDPVLFEPEGEERRARDDFPDSTEADRP